MIAVVEIPAAWRARAVGARPAVIWFPDAASLAEATGIASAQENGQLQLYVNAWLSVLILRGEPDLHLVRDYTGHLEEEVRALVPEIEKGFSLAAAAEPPKWRDRMLNAIGTPFEPLPDSVRYCVHKDTTGNHHIASLSRDPLRIWKLTIGSTFMLARCLAAALTEIDRLEAEVLEVH